MNSVLRTGLCVLIAGCLLSFAGCKKKADEAKPAAEVKAEAAKTAAEVKTEAAKTAAEVKTDAAKTAAEVKTDAAKTAAEVKTEATKTAAEVKAEAIETIPVADVQAEASKMTVEQLKAKAMEYKNLIVAKKAMIETLAAKLKGIPLTEQMGAEAKGLQTDIATLNKSVAALTERFQVYYNKLKEMGVDLSGLGI